MLVELQNLAGHVACMDPPLQNRVSMKYHGIFEHSCNLLYSQPKAHKNGGLSKSM